MKKKFMRRGVPKQVALRKNARKITSDFDYLQGSVASTAGIRAIHDQSL
jgi:hypothetical protein